VRSIEIGHFDASCLNANDPPRLDSLDRGQRLGNKWYQILKRVTDSAQDNNPETSPRNVLLVLQVLIAGQENVEPGGLTLGEQGAIL
jgi:hypothetical protein